MITCSAALPTAPRGDAKLEPSAASDVASLQASRKAGVASPRILWLDFY